MVVFVVKNIGFLVFYLLGVVYIVSKGLLDLGIVMFIEVVERVRDLVRVIDLFVFVDIDIGFGGVLNVVRIVVEMVEVKVVVV